MNINHLQYLYDAYRLGSVAAAARRHRISSSAVSQAIRSLEQHFSFALTKHERSFALTAAGEALVARAPELFAAAASIAEAMVETRDKFAGKLNIATQQSIAHALLPEFLTKLARSYPLMQTCMRFGTTAVVQSWLASDDIELALSVDNVAFDDFVSETLFEGEFVLVRASSAPHLGDDVALKAPFIVTENTRETRIFRREFERIHQQPVPVAMQIASWSVIRRMAECGLGIGLVPDYVLAGGSNGLLTRCELGLPRMPYRIAAYFRSRRKLSRLARTFLTEFEMHLRSTQLT